MGGTAGDMVLLGGTPGGTTGRPPASAPVSTTTDDDAELTADEPGRAPVDPEVAAMAHLIARRLSVPRPRRRHERRPGPGRLESLPYRGGSDEVDVDATLESLVASPLPEARDIVVREPVRSTRHLVLVVDVSGSMRGERVRVAAATVAALAGEFARDRLEVLAFWSDAAWVHRGEHTPAPVDLLDRLLALPARGLTNVAFPLAEAGRRLASSTIPDRRVVLLSDCVHNAGPDPRPVARGLPRLDVLLDAAGEKDEELGRDLARAGRGRFAIARDHRDVGSGLSTFFRP